MYSIQIENPYLAELARRVFQNRPVVEHADLLRFLEEQKLKLDLAESQRQLEQGDTLSVEEAFAGVYKKLGI